MNHILCIIGFLFLLFILNENKENFSQLILPNYNNTIFTGRLNSANKEIIIDKDNSRKPSPVEDVKQPPYSRFTKGEDGINDSPEDIKEINSSMDELTKNLDYFADIDINLSNHELNFKGICGEKQKLLKPAGFKTPWRRTGENNKSVKLFERFIIEKFSHNKERAQDCLWGYNDSARTNNDNDGCGILSRPCIDTYKGSGIGLGDLWFNSEGEGGRGSAEVTAQLIDECTGYNPTDKGRGIQYARFNCKRLCCNNLLFPIPIEGSSQTDISPEEIKIYKKYLDYLYEDAQENLSGVPYIEDSLGGIYQT